MLQGQLLTGILEYNRKNVFACNAFCTCEKGAGLQLLLRDVGHGPHGCSEAAAAAMLGCGRLSTGWDASRSHIAAIPLALLHPG